MENNDDEKLMISLIESLIRTLNQTATASNNRDITINAVSSLWIILFVLIIVQKAFKYIIKPCVRVRRTNEQNENGETDKNNATTNRDPSVECLIV